MTCSIDIKEMFERPVRMVFIEFEARQARRAGEPASACRWPEDSHEAAYWLQCYEKEKPPGLRREASIPHQRDVRVRQLRAINEREDSIWQA